MGIESHTDQEQVSAGFDEQFVSQKVEVDGRLLEFVSVKPEEIISEQWVVFLGGFGAGAEEYRAEVEDLFDSGRKVLFMNPLKGIEMEQGDIDALEAFDISDTIKSKAAEIIQVLEAAGIDRADFIGHSQGAILASVIAALRPGLAEDLVLNNPGGMHGEDTRGALVGRTVAGLAEQQVTNTKRAFTKPGELTRMGSVMKSVLTGTEITKKPIYRATKEIPGIVNSDIIPILESLKSNQEALDEDHQTKTILVTANKDRTFSPEKIETEIGFDTNSREAMDHALETVIDSYVMYVDKDAGHEAAIYEKSGLTAQILNEKYQVDKTQNKETD